MATAMYAPSKPSLKQNDQAPTCLNFLRAISGRDRVSLDYIYSKTVLPGRTPQTDILKENILQTPLDCDHLMADALEVHTYLANIIT